MGVLRVKDGVKFGIIAPAGFRILAALDHVAQTLAFDLVITSGTDGIHSSPTDPHYTGEAYDVRSHDIPVMQRQEVLEAVMEELGFEQFFGFLEAANTSAEHFHLQRAKGTIFP